MGRLAQALRVCILGPDLRALRCLAAALSHPALRHSEGPSGGHVGGMGWGAMGESPWLAVREVGEVGGEQRFRKVLLLASCHFSNLPLPLLRARRAGDSVAPDPPWRLGKLPRPRRSSAQVTAPGAPG